MLGLGKDSQTLSCGEADTNRIKAIKVMHNIYEIHYS